MSADRIVPRTQQGRIQDFKLGRGGAHLKKLRRAEGGAKIFGVFRVKNTILRQKIIFFQILGTPPLDPPLLSTVWLLWFVVSLWLSTTFPVRRLGYYDRCLHFPFSPPTICQSPSTHWKRKPPLSSCRALWLTSKTLGLTALFGPLLHGVCLGRVFVPTLSSWSGLKTIRPYENPALNKCGLSWFGLSWYGLG